MQLRVQDALAEVVKAERAFLNDYLARGRLVLVISVLTPTISSILNNVLVGCVHHNVHNHKQYALHFKVPASVKR